MSGARQPAALEGVRVLELGDELGQLCGKLLADMGADVIKVEPPTGSAVRSVPPFHHGVADVDNSLTFWHYNTSKRGITIDLEVPEDAARFRALAASADVILESLEPGYLSTLGLSYEDLSDENPGLIFCSLTPFGLEGPWAAYRATDLVHLALGGIMASTGYDTIPNAPPIAPTGGQAWHIPSYFAALAICVALFHRARTGRGQMIDVAAHEAAVVTTELAFHIAVYNGIVVQRQTGRHALAKPVPPQTFRTRDGRYINAMLINLDTRKWLALVDWLTETGEAEDLSDDEYLIPEILAERLPHAVEVVGRFIAKHDLDYLYHGAARRKLVWSPVRAVEDLQDDPHLAVDRAFFPVVEHPEVGESYPYIGAPLKFSRSPWQVRRAPLLGEHDDELAQELSRHAGAGERPPQARRQAPRGVTR